MELSENLKLRLDHTAGENPQDRIARAPDAASTDPEPIDEAESQMRKALGLLGDAPRHRSESERSDQSNRMGDRFNGGLHRRRFVQDGDIPVTVLRRDQAHEAPLHRGVAAVAAPSSSRLQRTEAALAAETAAREKAERSLAETQAVARDLQTKIGHAELAKNEAIETLRRDREAVAQLRADFENQAERLQAALTQARVAEETAESCEGQLAKERQARKAAEKALRSAESAREAAEQVVRSLSEEAPAPRRVEAVRRPRAEPEVAAANSRRPRAQDASTGEAEPEPVKWWLNSKPAGKRR